MPEPQALTMKKTAATSSSVRRPNLSARRQAPGEEGADGAAEQHRGDVEAGADALRLESLLKAVDGAVDDPAIEAEQEAADGGHAADEQNHDGVL